MQGGAAAIDIRPGSRSAIGETRQMIQHLELSVKHPLKLPVSMVAM